MPKAVMPEEEDKIEAILNGDVDVDELLEEESETVAKEEEGEKGSPEAQVPEEGVDEDEFVAIENMPDDAELWLGGPKIAEIKAWKQQYENVYVTSITFEKHVVWRTLNRAEYKAHMRNMEKLVDSGTLSQTAAGLYNEEAIAELCILFPKYDRKNSGNEMAGVPSIIAQEVMEASGFQALEVRQL